MSHDLILLVYVISISPSLFSLFILFTGLDFDCDATNKLVACHTAVREQRPLRSSKWHLPFSSQSSQSSSLLCPILVSLKSFLTIMTDWSKFKVVDLKEECKSRGISLTGLKLKQQYIDKLEEYESQNAEEPNAAPDSTETEPAEEQPVAQANGESEEADEGVADVKDTEQKSASKGESEEDKPAEPQEEDAQVENTIAKQDEEQAVSDKPSGDDPDVKESEAAPEAANVAEKVDEEMLETHQQDAPIPDAKVEAEDVERVVQNSDQKPAPLSTPQILSDTSTPLSSQVPASDIAEDQRKRRKRSATPDPSAEEVARKKARLSGEGEGPGMDERSSLEQMESTTEKTQDVCEEPETAVPIEANVEESKEDVASAEPVAIRDDATPKVSKEKEKELSPQPQERSSSLSEDHDVVPAIHQATSSLYIRNFKRPLHIPSLRNHIASIARSRSTDDSDAITLFYLDNIRTHAFVSFTSIAAASRVRAAMHGMRFPDEANREPLFVDYVPDDKVQPWIDEETGAGFGRGGGGRRFEVVYEDGKDGVEAIFQEVDNSRPRPLPEPSRTSRQSIDRPRAEAPLPQGIHSDRSDFIPRDRRDDGLYDRPRAPPTGPRNPGSTGRGFQALDELFDSTTAKPKLYYKPVQDAIVTERLEMLRNLRVGYAEMGRSGDEGMKRYSFERYKEREEFVDKGPEFGYGKRGQARLVGGGPGGGGGRGRGGFRGRGDSWRGAAGR